MNWLQKISKHVYAQQEVYWHATTPQLAEQIINQRMIKPSVQVEEETGSNVAGWNFPEETGQYGDGVYLATSAREALYYADIRLRLERNEEEADLFSEDLEYLALFRIYITNPQKLISVGTDEVKYQGIITDQPGEAWYEGPTWASRSRDAQQHRDNVEQSEDEIGDAR